MLGLAVTLHVFPAKVYVCMYVCMYECVYTFVYMSECMYVCIYLCMYLENILKCFLISLFLLIVQTSVLNTADIKLSLSLFSSSHSDNKRYTVWSAVPQGHVGVSIILNRCRYDLMLPCPVTMVVKLWIMFIFILIYQLLPACILL